MSLNGDGKHDGADDDCLVSAAFSTSSWTAGSGATSRRFLSGGLTGWFKDVGNWSADADLFESMVVIGENDDGCVAWLIFGVDACV